MLTTGPLWSSKKPLGDYTPDDFDSQALSAVINEKTQWNEMAVNVANRVQYMMRNVVDQARRYNSGVFESQYDEITGERKIWVPMTETAVESVKKSIDFDTKDVLISPGRPSAVNIIPLVRAAIFNLFEKIGFGNLLNMITDTVSRDGTCIVKSYIVIDHHTGKKVIKSTIVDMMNFWIDPSADNIQDTTVIERSILSRAEIETYRDVWDNMDDVQYTTNPNRLTDISNISSGNTEYAEIWERWGLIPLSWITKKEKDNDKLVEGHMIFSGVGSPGVRHLIRKNPRKDGVKPYEECWYRKVNGRWPGRGIPEMLFGLQEYVNEVVNIRRSNNRLLQNGIFLIRKGSGITPDMLNAITAGGGLPVTNINNDIKQLTVQDYRQSSYTDEDRVSLMADRVTGAFDINRGEVGAASASATATLTRDRHIRDTFILIQENIGFFLQNLIKRHYIPLLKEIMTEEDYIKVTGDADYLAFIDEQIVNGRKNKFISDSMKKTGFYPDQEDLDKFSSEQSNYLKSMGKQRFVSYFKNIFDEEYDVSVSITDESYNRDVAVQQLRDMLITYSNMPIGTKLNVDEVFREMLNIMGIRGEFFLNKPQIPSQGGAQTSRLLKELPTQPPTETTAFANANKLPQMQPPALPQQMAPQVGGQVPPGLG